MAFLRLSGSLPGPGKNNQAVAGVVLTHNIMGRPGADGRAHEEVDSNMVIHFTEEELEAARKRLREEFSLDGLAVGRIVHYVMPNGQHRPAVVVRVWGEEMCPAGETVQLQVFTDGSNDANAPGGHPQFASGLYWATSVKHSEPVAGVGTGAHTWHWPERE